MLDIDLASEQAALFDRLVLASIVDVVAITCSLTHLAHEMRPYDVLWIKIASQFK